MADFYIKVNNVDKILEQNADAIRTAMKAVALEMEANAKVEITRKVYDTPISPSGYIRTGRLRNSIANDSDDTTAQVGTNVEYAPYVELGTSKMTERPFLKPAVENHLDEYKEIIQVILNGI